MLNHTEDQLSRQLALDPAQSFIVQAPAGSGKTELLIQRFLTLLATVNSPEEILAITFTKKAAGEMKERIIQALHASLNSEQPSSLHHKQTWLLGKKVLQQDKKLNWKLLKNPNQLRIQTIDSFCAYLTKQLPLRSHIGSQADIADHPDFLYREAVDEVLHHLEENVPWSNAISQLLLHLDNDLNKLYYLLIHLLKKRDQWMSYIQFHTDDITIKLALEKQLAAVISDHLTQLKHLISKEELTEVVSILEFTLSQLPTASISYDIKSLPGIKSTDLAYWLAIANLLITKSNTWKIRFDSRMGFPALNDLTKADKPIHIDYRKRLSALINSFNERDELRLALVELSFLPADQYDEQQWSMLQCLLHVLKIAAAQLRVAFQQHGYIDYIENTQAALTALGQQENPSDLALSLDYQIKHILVDEFQDTSYTQYQLLEKLIAGWESGDGRTLFVVGDPMQSIYRFREAEVGLFIRMFKNGIGQFKLTPLKLSVNFRSHPEIVAWNNHHYKNIFPSTNDIATGAVSYTSSFSPSTKQNHDADISIHGLIDDNESTQANHIVNLICEIKEKYPNEKIAILVRTRTHLKQIILALKKADIYYRAVDIDPLVSQQHVQDLLSLTRALLNPADRIAWLSILRAPWCGLTLSDLLIITDNNPHTAILTKLNQSDIFKQLSDNGQVRINRILPILKSALAERERKDLRNWLENTWILLGGPACLQNKSDLEDVNVFFNLLSQIYQQSLTVDMQQLKEKMDSLYATPHHDDSLQIMTIHSAKGLEFDTVILPHLERRNATDDRSLLLWMEQTLNNNISSLLLAPLNATGNDKDSIYEYIFRQQKLKAEYETDRLLYVATTRAIKRLHLFYQLNPSDNGQSRIAHGSFLEKLWPLIKNDHQQHHYNEKELNENNAAIPSRYLMRLSSEWVQPIHPTLESTSAHQQQQGFQFQQSQSKIIGIVTHHILQNLTVLGLNWWSNKNENEKLSYIRFHFQQQGISNNTISLSTKIILQMIDNMLQDTRGQWILKNHQLAQSEFALSASLNQIVHQVVIDRTFVVEGIRWIIDYKTTMTTQDEVNYFLEKEKKKYKEKMQLYADIMKQCDHYPIRLGLYFPALPSWIEWESS